MEEENGEDGEEEDEEGVEEEVADDNDDRASVSIDVIDDDNFVIDKQLILIKGS